MVISGGKDTIIEVRQLGKAPKENADALLLGHAHNVCSLDVSPDGRWVVSGSWDATARVWGVGKWECEAVLEGHEGSVWDVLAFDPETVITGMDSGRDAARALVHVEVGLCFRMWLTLWKQPALTSLYVSSPVPGSLFE